MNASRQRNEPQERELGLERLRAKVDAFKVELMRYMRGEAEWCCDKCGHHLDPGEWVSPRTLRDQVYRDADYERDNGSCISIALMNLVRDGELEQNTRWEVRLPQVPQESPLDQVPRHMVERRHR